MLILFGFKERCTYICIRKIEDRKDEGPISPFFIL